MPNDELAGGAAVESGGGRVGWRLRQWIFNTAGCLASADHLAANSDSIHPVDKRLRSFANEPWRERYPFASHERIVDDRWRLHFVDEYPTGAPRGTLLFVHGNPTWSFHWRELIQAFRGEFRCVAVDHVGCGLSEKPARSFRLEDRIRHLTALIDQLDLQHVTLVAQDWGGAIGIGALLRRRERFVAAALLNTGAFRPWFIPWRIRVCRAPGLGRIGLQGLNLFSRAALRMTMNQRSLPSDLAQAYLAPYDCWSHRRAVYDFVQDIPLSERHPTWRTLGAIEDGLPELADLPVQLIWGMRDWCFTPECLRRFQQVWPRARSLELPDAGHWVVEDAPEQVRDELRVFLATGVASGKAGEISS